MTRKIHPPEPPYLGPAKFHGGAQNLAPLRRIVLHGTVSPCVKGGARSIADYFKHRVTRPSSAHYVVDPAEVVQVVGDHQVAFHAPPNSDSIGVEHCDPVSGPKARWADAAHTAMLRKSARLVAQLCLAYDVPIRHVGRLGLLAGKRGITEHASVSKAWHQTSHTDMGPGFPWRRYMKMVREEAAFLLATPQPTKAPTPIPSVPATPKPVRKLLRIIQANFLKTNPRPADDIALLDKSGADVIGLNEARKFIGALGRMANYRLVGHGAASSAMANNPILLKHGSTEFVRSFGRKMCSKVGTSPERDATVAVFRWQGEDRAHVQTHTNAHIENGGKPRLLPRVKQDIIHMQNLTALVRELQAQRLRVTIGGDFNWAWVARAAVWTWSPTAVFKRLGMTSQWGHKTAPQGGSLGRRRIDYIAYDPDDLTIHGQRIVTGEHSDHRWPEVTFTT